MKLRLLFPIVVIALIIGIDSLALSQSEAVLHNFTVMPDGKSPQASLIADTSGNLYGVTQGGGTYGYGVVFKLSLSGGKWIQSLLYHFTGTSDGAFPSSTLIFDKAGNLYGEAYGGLTTCYEGCGVVYRLSPNADGSWTQAVIYNFVGGTDSSIAYGSLIFDGVGNLYGVGNGGASNQGTVFALTPRTQGQWTETILYNFTGLADGGGPDGALVFDTAGNLYGTTSYGGDPNCDTSNNNEGCGIVFKLTNNGSGNWIESTLLQFEWLNGAYPVGNLVIDSTGNLYGLTFQGPGGYCSCGTFFRLSPNVDGGWTYSLLYTFAGGPDAEYVNGGLIEDSQGNFYGTSYNGGLTSAGGGVGTVFEISPSSAKTWKEKVLYRFTKDGFVGQNPSAGVIVDSLGSLYGTAPSGGVDCLDSVGCGGTVFELSPASGKWIANSLYQFAPGGDGFFPLNTPARDSAGNLYVAASIGGKNVCGAQSCGAVFQFSPLANGTYSERDIYDFTTGATYNGQQVSSFIFDSSGNIYGTSEYGGSVSCSGGIGCGMVFQFSPTPNCPLSPTLLYNFQGGSDGEYPAAALTFDANGNLYGTTLFGGGGLNGCCGTVFELTPGSGSAWTEKTLYAFKGTTDGDAPNSSLVFDSLGNLYGTTEIGGVNTHICPYNCGTVFKLSQNVAGQWTESVIHAFTGGSDGIYPRSVIIDGDGNLFGTTYAGGKDSTTFCGGGCGTGFELSPSNGSWTKTILYSFQPYEVSGDGAEPGAGLALAADGSLYGTTIPEGLHLPTSTEWS